MLNWISFTSFCYHGWSFRKRGGAGDTASTRRARGCMQLHREMPRDKQIA